MTGDETYGVFILEGVVVRNKTMRNYPKENILHIQHGESLKKDNLMSLALLFHHLLLNMFRMLVHPSLGAYDLFVELFHGFYFSEPEQYNTRNKSTISRKLLKIDVLTFETC